MGRMLLFIITVTLAGCDSTGPGADITGTYTGNFGMSATATDAERGTREGPFGPVTFTIAHRSDGNYDFSVTSPSGGPTFVIGVGANGVFSFPNFNEAQALQVGTAMFAGLCSTSGAVVTPSGQYFDFTRAVSLGIVVKDTWCDWGYGTQDLRPTQISIGYSGSKLLTSQP